MSDQPSVQGELRRIRGVADMLCTGHAELRDCFARGALILDLVILGLSTWLIAIAFVGPRIGSTLTPFGLENLIWVGFLSVGTFFLTLVQRKVDWKGKADAHRRALEIYAEVKRESGYLLAQGNPNGAEIKRVVGRYDFASTVSVSIPERCFLKIKRRHRTKVAISEHLDSHPSASLLLTRVRIWIRDNKLE